MHTPRQSRTILTSKLELIPITDEIVPSIETPRSERVPAAAFTRGAIHIDSPPPQEMRTEYDHLRRESGNHSPVKRKREPSPRTEADIRRREVIYLPIREGRTTYISQPTNYGLCELPRYEQRPDQANKVVYLPLDENNNVRPPNRQDRNYAGSRYDTRSSAPQVYLDDPQRYNGQSRDYNSGVKYQYIPLGSVKPDDSNHSSPRLIPLDGSPDMILTRRPLNDEHTYRSFIPLDSPTLRNQRRQYDEVGRVIYQDMIPRRSVTEIRGQIHFQGRPQVLDEPQVQWV